MKKYLNIIILILSSLCFAQAEKVVNIIDGDTFELEGGEKVRMIGINSPEKKDVFGDKSKNHLKNLILGKSVTLKADNICSDRDRYQRLLRYVYLDEIDVNLKMIEDGYAFAYLTYKFSKSQQYKDAQLNSQENNLGIWASPSKDKTETTKKREPFRPNRKLVIIGLAVIVIFSIGLFNLIRK